ncbi:MAG: uracil-DNA glycosylase [Gammaproteobacteria bacterium RIFCSPHIGHO2_12_FULL_45_9]|nr:MAG: uracil-DNA glycosylase [Gammaproteobacteria bacterium RIFCSPHIGHO2_12_FULL_45_9]
MKTDTLTWSDLLGEEKQKPYFQAIQAQLATLRAEGKTIYPPQQAIFAALKYTPFEAVKVVILGQDPYHGPKQAHGLSFSVQPGIPFPPSLRNIFLELKNDLNVAIPKSGCLIPWAQQGVLLLNTVLTVEAGQAHSHAHLGWQTFTDAVIRALNQHPERIVFLLWGSPAQQKASLIDTHRHLILRAPHPSPLSAHRGFLGCRHFSKANEALISFGREPIQWALIDATPSSLSSVPVTKPLNVRASRATNDL